MLLLSALLSILPFFNQRVDLQQFWDWLKEQYFELEVIPTKEKCFKRLYPERAFDAQQVRLLMSLLLKLIERYFACTIFLEEDLQLKLYQAKAYRKRNIPTHFQYTIQNLERLQEKQPFQHAESFVTRYQVQLERYQFTSTQKRVGEQNLQEISDTMDIAFVAQKLRQSCFTLAHQAVYNVEYDLGLLSEVLSFVKRSNLLDIPAIALYYHCYYALTEPKEERHFSLFKDLIFTSGQLFPTAENE